MKLTITVIILLVISCGCSYFNEKLHLKDDNDVEEVIEDLLNQKTGLDLDLTPKSRENYA